MWSCLCCLTRNCRLYWEKARSGSFHIYTKFRSQVQIPKTDYGTSYGSIHLPGWRSRLLQRSQCPGPHLHSSSPNTTHLYFTTILSHHKSLPVLQPTLSQRNYGSNQRHPEEGHSKQGHVRQGNPKEGDPKQDPKEKQDSIQGDRGRSFKQEYRGHHFPLDSSPGGTEE